MIVFSIVAAILALLFVIYLSFSILRLDQGNERMIQISQAVQAGAKAFLKREYRYIAGFVLIIAVLIAIAPLLSTKKMDLGWQTAVAFLLGSVMSAIAGYIGMSIATRSNARTAHAADTSGLKGAIGVAISSGAVMGFSVVGLALLGLVILVMIYGIENTWIINGYAMGASLVALFARSGGGIFTKGADMGADLVGKVEAGIPEDDPRNPAVIADNVGDNVGDVAGLGADLLESYVEAIIATMAIAVSFNLAGAIDGAKLSVLGYLPLYIASAGIVSSILGIFYVKFMGRQNPQSALMGGTYLSAILTAVASYFIVKGVVPEGWYKEYSQMGPYWATLLGVVSGIVVGFISEYYTSGKYQPVRKLAENSKSGPAITVTSGVAVGMASTAIPVIVLGISVILSYHFADIYGVALAAFGMLATTGMIVAVDSYGPVADNAGGIAEMAKMRHEVREITDSLDSVGNTTAAIGKGFAIGSAAFAAMGLLVAYMQVAQVSMATLDKANVLAGILIGAMMPYFFSSMLFQAVSKAAFEMIDEVRRQFREIKGLTEGKVMPDSARCVDISANSAIKGMLVPGSLAIISPVILGLYDKEVLAGFLVGSLASGLMLGIQMANSGGAMDNAKKYIEAGNFGGKGSETHKAAVVGDTVGDPLKDTVGPSINILIKLMAVISLVLAPLFA